jgi:TetR/AcrR family transcriptional regulator
MPGILSYMSLTQGRSDAVNDAPPRRLPARERKAQIVAAAREVFVEQGLQGTRTRDIADRAGITEAYLYRHFHSKDELHTLAIEAPLEELVERLRVDTRELSDRDDVSRADVLLHCHELMLGCMIEIAPLVVGTLARDSPGSHGLYADYLFPNLRDILEMIIPDITGFPVDAFEVDFFVEAMIGVHLTIALQHLLEGEQVDVPYTARQITAMVTPRVLPRAYRPRRGHYALSGDRGGDEGLSRSASPAIGGGP